MNKKNKLPLKKLKAVIFDMDGVLVDSEPVYYKVEQELFRSLGLRISRELHHSFVGLSMRSIWQKIKQDRRLDLTLDELISLHKQLMIRGFKSLIDPQPISGIIPLLNYLHGKEIKTALASSSSHDLIDVILKRSGLTRYFHIKVSGEDVKQGKPEPDIFLEALERLGLERSDAMIIEDSANGIQGAKKAGIFTVGYCNSNSGHQDVSKADLAIADFDKLLKIITNDLDAKKLIC